MFVVVLLSLVCCCCCIAVGTGFTTVVVLGVELDSVSLALKNFDLEEVEQTMGVVVVSLLVVPVFVLLCWLCH